MSSVGSAGFQTDTEEEIASQSYQPGGRTLVWPFSGTLGEDKELKLSCENFKQSIDYFYEEIDTTPLSQLTATPPFPTPYVLAQLANKTYTDYKKRETDAQYETRLALPNGWMLLTTASNVRWTNGYYGASYWHPERQQVVIVHRGIKPTKFGALWTDLFGVRLQNRVPQMGSACTFAHKVVEVLQAVHREKGVSFQLFFTGHCLGGWLAQITTLTTEYLSRGSNISHKSNQSQYCYHPHTVVFDNPGCKYMLAEMRDKLNVRLQGFATNLRNLDITSYRSAPNRINTCNTHVGTVYRILTDLSEMGWWHKRTPLYNLATHSIDQILKAFDPGTGQVSKDEQGLPKVQIVVDWPVSHGLTGGEEYNSFFEWANCSNSYHPVMTKESLPNVRLPYQTKPYEEMVHRLSVFSPEELNFLRQYRWMRQWSEFFMPKHLFTVLENNEAQKQAVNLLQSFEIEKDKIRCKDGSELQALIPYVKRLLQLFPEIRESTERAVASNETRNKVYRHQTRLYLKEISQNPLDFKPEALRLTDFITSDQQQLLQVQMANGDEWTGLIKVYQVLQKTGCLSEGQYFLLKLEILLTANYLLDFITFMQSTVTPHLLLMSCEVSELLDDEAEDKIRKLFNTIQQKPNIKIILSTRSDSTTISSLQQISKEIFGNGFVKRTDQVNWDDITTLSQHKLLEKLVIFQGVNISLQEILSAESPAANFLPLGALLDGKELKIADPVPFPNAQNEGYYIGETFRRKTVIKRDILWDKCTEKFPDLLVRTEEQFRQFSQNNPKNNVHWLEKEKSGKLL
jgi:hypothetical protein